MIDIKPLSFLDPRLFAPEVDVTPVAQGNLAATQSVMAGVNKAIGSVGEAYIKDKADKKAGEAQAFDNWKDVDASQRGWKGLEIAGNRPSNNYVDPFESMAHKSFGSYAADAAKNGVPIMPFQQYRALLEGSNGKSGVVGSGFGAFANPK